MFANRKKEFGEKLTRLRGGMQGRGVENILITEAHNFSWLCCGAENFVFFAMSQGAAPVMVTPEKVLLVSNNIESVRLFAEEMADLDVEDCHHLWHLNPGEIEEHLKQQISGRWSKDTDLADLFHQVRDPLMEDEIERYRWVGANAEEALRTTCQQIEPGMTEYQTAGILAKSAYERGIYPALILIASDERAYNFRHPIPTKKEIENHVMVVLCARRYGLITSATRMVALGTIDEELHRRHEAVCTVDAALNLNSKPGVTLGDVLQSGIQAYKDNGYADEWKLHHQGGTTGYLGRTDKGIPGNSNVIMANQAVAWNPSIAGTKCEDTLLVKEDGYEILTKAKEWPMIQVAYNGQTMDRCGFYIP